MIARLSLNKASWRRRSQLRMVGGSVLRTRTWNDLTESWTRSWRNTGLHHLREWNPALDELWSQWAVVYLMGRAGGLGIKISRIMGGVNC